jgi:hypothetical protein
MWKTVLVRIRSSNGAREYVQPGPGLKFGPKETAAIFEDTNDPAFEAKKQELRDAIRPVRPGIEPGFEWDPEDIEVPDAP